MSTYIYVLFREFDDYWEPIKGFTKHEDAESWKELVSEEDCKEGFTYYNYPIESIEVD